MFSALFAAHFAFTGWRLAKHGDERDKHGFWIILTYAVVSYLLFWAYVAPVHAFVLVHLLAAVIFLAYSSKLTGHLIGISFCLLVGLDVLVLTGWLPFARANSFWNIAYADLKGLISHVILFCIWKGAGDARIYQSFLRDPLVSSGSNSGGLLSLENEQTTAEKK